MEGKHTRDGQLKWDGTAKLTPSSFDADQPAAFYLLDNREGMEALSDATLVVQGVELPVHSQVVLREPFAGCTLFEVALFLRCAYRPADLTPTNLDAVRGSLLGLLRLADQLDAPGVMHALAVYMRDCVGAAAPQAELLEWAEAAEQCCLPELRMRCLTEVAHRLAWAASSLASSFSATAELAGCNHSTLSTLVGLLAAGCGPTGAPRVLENSPAAAVEALEASAQHGSFQWTVERYSKLPAVRGDNTYSLYFWAGGVKWRFRIFPGGDKEEAAGHLSVFLCPRNGGFTARYTITLVDQGASKQDVQREKETPKAFKPIPGSGYGYNRFASAKQLYSPSNGYLLGDRLVLRARVEVVAHTASEPQP